MTARHTYMLLIFRWSYRHDKYFAYIHAKTISFEFELHIEIHE